MTTEYESAVKAKVQVQVQHAYLVRPLQLDRWRMTIKTYGKKNN